MLLNEEYPWEPSRQPETASTLHWELHINRALKKLSSALIASPEDIQQFASLILQVCLEITGSYQGMVTQVDPATGGHLGLSFTDVGDEVVSGFNQPIQIDADANGTGAGLWSQALRAVDAMIVNGGPIEGSDSSRAGSRTVAHRMMSVPVRLSDTVVGHIVVIGSAAPYSQRQLRALEQIGELYALALQRQRMEDEKISLVSRLQQAQKMEAIGTLAGGIAHDFNNILFPIIGYTEMALCDGIEDEVRGKYLNETLKAANRARELVQQILTFSRQDRQEKMPLTIQSIVKEAIKLLRSSLPATIDIRSSVDKTCGQILADPSQVHQIIMNLATNAYHAMRDKGGVLSIDLSQINIPERDRHFCVDANPGRYVRLSVSDTGHGMPQNVVERIFDPYFTTKTNGEGSGLGLSVVHGIVKNCNGFISVDSAPGRGTAFTVFFPLIADDADRQRHTDPDQLPTGSECILLVDDEEQIVDMERQILQRLGYTVFSATNGIDALEMFKADPQKYDLVITDQTMPKMTGLDLAGHMLEVRSDLPIILSTGLSETAIGDDGDRSVESIRAFVYKPLVIKDLACTIRQALQ